MTDSVAPAVSAAPVLPKLDPEAYEPIPGEISFRDFMAGLNPLQHLPVIGTIYRELTGERIPPPMQVLGGALLGGPLGMVSAAVMATLDQFRGGAASPSQAVAAYARQAGGRDAA